LNPPRIIEIPSHRYGLYRVRSRLGVGGMAEVFLAEIREPDGSPAPVALKLMREGQDAGAFAAEADLMGLLEHPNLVQRLEVGEAYGRLYIAMEALLGGDLRGLVELHQTEGYDFPHAVSVHLAIEVLKGLSYFHQASSRTGVPLQLVHGDVNPANVFFGDTGEVKLGDFGVATSRRAAIGPEAGIAAGKLRYFAPEQTRGETVTPATDVFAVGVMLYELVVGRHPFLTDGMDERSIILAMRQAKLTLPDDVPKLLASVLKRALIAEPRERIQTAGEFAGGLLHYALDHGQALQPRQIQNWLEGLHALPG